MKSFILLLSLSLIFASCSTAYKSGQTPDDVYFSPERPRAEYVRVDDDEDRYYRGQSDRNNNDYYNYEEERYLRMKVRNRQRWSYLDNDFYSYNPYAYNNFGYYYNSPWNSYSYWDHYYNPYARQVIIFNSRTPVVNRPRTINLRTFDGVNNAPNNQRVYGTKPGNSNNNRTYSAPRRSVGNELRDIFNNTNTNSSNTPSSNRTSTNSSSGSSSSGSSSSGGGSAPARRF